MQNTSYKRDYIFEENLGRITIRYGKLSMSFSIEFMMDCKFYGYDPQIFIIQQFEETYAKKLKRMDKIKEIFMDI